MSLNISQWTFDWADHQHYGAQIFKECASTNQVAKSEAFTTQNMEELLVLYVADSQTAGRGRGQNTWSGGKPGKNLLSSWSFLTKTQLQPHHSASIGLALYEAAQKTWSDLNFSLKAPNDLFLDDKKVAGLLVEIVSQGEWNRVIIGLGMNVADAPSNIETATSLEAAKADLTQGTWEAFLERLCFKFTSLISDAEAELSPEEQQSLLNALNKNPNLTEKYLRVEKDGSLVLPSGTQSWAEL